MKLFGRRYRLTLLDGNNALTYEPPYQIQFAVDVWAGNSGGTAQITLYGISSKTRKRIFEEFDSLKLEAGFEDRFGLIFAGDIINVEMGRKGPDSYIRFYARTAGKAQLEAEIIKEWGSNTPQQEIIRDIAERLLLPVEFIGDFSDLPRAIRGDNINSNAAQALDELAALHGFRWWLGANRLIIIRGDTPREGALHEVNYNTGMVGSPQILIQGIEVSTKLDSTMLPGDLINVQAQTRNFAFSGVYQREYRNSDGGSGRYYVLGLRHEGDYFTDLWDTAIRGIRPDDTN